MNRKKLTPREFVAAWAKSAKAQHTLEQFGKSAGISYMRAWNEARRLTSMGVHLPLLWGQRRPNGDMVRELNSIIKNIMGEKS